MENVTIDKDSTTPVYRQIVEQVTMLVQTGSLRAGDRLPAERALASKLQVARGTITKAYAELSRARIVELVQGHGTFVSTSQNVLDTNRKRQALAQIDLLLDELLQMDFSHREILTFVQILLSERVHHAANIRICLVDCNPEALTTFRKQLRYISQVDFSQYLLHEIASSPDPVALLADFDLILTTSNHYQTLQKLVPALGHITMQAAVSLGQQTLIDIAKLSPGVRIGIVCQSRQFLEIIRSTLRGLGLPMRRVKHLVGSGDLASFSVNQDVLVVPPDDSGFLANVGDLEAFTAKGKQIIHFDYQIERGSLIHIEEQILRVSDRK